MIPGMTEELKRNLKDLSDLLDVEISLHEDLKRNLQKKLDAIGERDTETLENLIKVEEEIISRIAEVENERADKVEKIADELNISKDVKAFELCEMIPVPFSTDLMLKFAKLMELLNDISLLNMCVRGLLEFESSYIDFTLKLLSGKLNKGVYTKAGKEKNLPSFPTFFDGRV